MDFGGRWYMADLCRWGQVDPLAEQGYSRTPYHYVRNNPLAFVDPTGLGEDPAPLPGATVYSEENANRKKRKEAFEAQSRERDREYGLSSPSPNTTQNGLVGDYYFDEAGNFSGFTAGEENRVFVKSACGYDDCHGSFEFYAEYDPQAFLEFVAIVVGETSARAVNKFEEAQAIGDVILNRLDEKNAVLLGNFIHQIGGPGQYDAIGAMERNPHTGKLEKGAYSVIKEGSISVLITLGSTYKARIKGAISSLSDINRGSSNGAYFWNSTAQKNWKHKGFNWRNYNKGVLSITTTIGGTTFFRYSDQSKTWP